MKTTFIALISVYSIFSILMLFMAGITDTNYGASSVQEFFAVICSLFIASAPIYCGIALGMSVFLRRKGRSLAGFIVHFAGFVSLLLSFSFYNIRKSGSLTEI